MAPEGCRGDSARPRQKTLPAWAWEYEDITKIAPVTAVHITEHFRICAATCGLPAFCKWSHFWPTPPWPLAVRLTGRAVTPGGRKRD